MFLDEETLNRLKDMKNGIVYIILTTKNRFGNEEDIRDIRDVFENYYNSKVYVWQDLNITELRKKFSKVKKSKEWNETYKNAEFLVCFALSAVGGDGRFGLCNDFIINATVGIHRQFVRAPGLRLKPRWLILQSRRGSNQHYHLNIITDAYEKRYNPEKVIVLRGIETVREHRDVMRYTDYHYNTEGNEEQQVHHMKKFCEEIKQLKIQ